MKTTDELNALKEEYKALDKKLSMLTDEELEQVAGGSRRTDDPEQVECHRCFNFALWYVEEQSQTLTPAYKAELLGKINYVWDRTLSWHLADPFELLPIVEQIIAMLETVKDQEAPLYNAWVKMKASIPYLEEMKRKS